MFDSSARVLAQRVTKEQATDETRLARAFALVLGRQPAGQEPALLAKMLTRQRAIYAADAYRVLVPAVRFLADELDPPSHEPIGRDLCPSVLRPPERGEDHR